jgi:hypothetical protein
MKKLIFFISLFFCLAFFTAEVYGYCYPGAPTVRNPVVTSSSQCMERIKSSFNRGEQQYKIVTLQKGEIYRASASGCPRAGNIKLRVTKSGKEYASSASEYSPKLCFKAPVSGTYTFRVILETTRGGSSWGNVNACFYQSRSC